MRDIYQGALEHAAQIEAELRAMGGWAEAPPPDAAFESGRAFFADTMTFYQWLQFVMLARIREIAAEKGAFPGESQVGAYAVRELDGAVEAAGLISRLCEFDDFIEHAKPRTPRRRRHTGTSVQATVEPEPTAAAEPRLTPEEVVERYWRTRDAGLLHSSPRPSAGFDASLAERVFESVVGLVEVLSEPVSAEGPALRTLVESWRGWWVIVTVLRDDNGQWRVDLPLSIARTAVMFLSSRGTRPPFSESNDARGRAMQFWSFLQNRDWAGARGLAVDPDAALPEICTGTMDEFCWYLDHDEKATVRVLVNLANGHRIWFTRMVAAADGEWRVDTRATFGAAE